MKSEDDATRAERDRLIEIALKMQWGTWITADAYHEFVRRAEAETPKDKTHGK